MVSAMLIELGPGGGLDCKHALVGCCVYPSRSVAIRDVPCAELCSVTLALTVPLGEPLTAQFPLTLLLIQHEQGNLLQFVVACEDAVGIEFHVVVCVVCTIADRPSAVGKHCEMCINHQVDHLVSGRHAEAVAPPVNCHLWGCHGVKHEHVQFFESVALDCHGAGVFEICHVPIISTRSGSSLVPILCASSATGAKRLTWVSISGSIFNVKAITIVPVFLQ